MIGKEGKRFEEDFKSSCDEASTLLLRLKDATTNWSNAGTTRFTSEQPADYIAFRDRIFYAFELKSTKSNSMTFWSKEFEQEDDTKKTYNIRKGQVLGLQKMMDYPYVVAGLIFNFRERENKTYFVHIKEFLRVTSLLPKKSFNYDEVQLMKPIEIYSIKKRTRHSYDMESFFITIYQMMERNGGYLYDET